MVRKHSEVLDRRRQCHEVEEWVDATGGNVALVVPVLHLAHEAHRHLEATARNVARDLTRRHVSQRPQRWNVRHGSDNKNDLDRPPSLIDFLSLALICISASISSSHCTYSCIFAVAARMDWSELQPVVVVI